MNAHKTLLITVGVSFMALTPVYAGDQYNPQNDPKIKEGYEKHQREYKETQERRERDDKAQKEDGQPRNEEQWRRNQYPQGDDDKYGVKQSHDQPKK